jgi:anaerobic magnesium-protoporphyrin IX monomethyl ester cyclase
MRFLFVNPPFKMAKHLVYSPNTGLAYLAAYLLREGHELSCLEMNQIREVDCQERLKKAVAAFEPQAVGFTLMAPQSSAASQLCQTLRRVFDGPIVLGGPQPTCMGESIFQKFPEVDLLVSSEGEITTAELLKVLEHGGDLAQVAGILYRRDGEVRRTATRPFIKDLDSIPWPLYDLFGYASMAQYPLLTSRGCPFECVFCYKIFGNVCRFRNVARCIEELTWATEYYHTTRFKIIDDAFNLQPQRAEEFCDLLLDQKLNLQWAAPFLRADRVTPTLARKMKASGCLAASVGLESFDPEIFGSINKGENLSDLVRGTTLLRNAGLVVGGSLVIGLPNDTFQKTLHSFHEAMTLVDRVDLTIATPIPGTALYDWVQQESTFLVDLEAVMGNGYFESAPFETPEYTAPERIRAFKLTGIIRANIPDMPTRGPKPIRSLKFGLLVISRFLGWNILILRYDGVNYFKYLRYFFKRLKNILLSRRDLSFEHYDWHRVPDGTWSLTKDKDLRCRDRSYQKMM